MVRCCRVEFISGLLHITLDNPAFQHTPFIGSMARDFQWHHKKPTHICQMTWSKFLGAIDAGVIVLFIVGQCTRFLFYRCLLSLLLRCLLRFQPCLF